MSRNDCRCVRVRCEECGATFWSKPDENGHVFLACPDCRETEFECDECGATFWSKVDEDGDAIESCPDCADDDDADVETEFECDECGTSFWSETDEDGDSVKACPECYGEEDDEESSLPALYQGQEIAVPELPELPVPDIFRNRHLMFRDIEALLYEASEPITNRSRGLMEWLRGADLQAEHMARKQTATQRARSLTSERTALFNEIESMIEAATAAQIAEFEHYIAVRQAHWCAVTKEQEARHEYAINEARARTELLEEAVHQRQLVESVRGRRELVRTALADFPAQSEQKALPEADPIADERLRRRTIASGKVALIDDCIAELRQVKRSRRRDPTEKAAAMRAILDTYAMEVEDLPRDLQRFIGEADDGV
jgi:hypothetical protein